MARIDDVRFVARFVWPGVVGIALSLASLGAPHLDRDSLPAAVAVPIGILMVSSFLALFFLYPLAILGVVLALFRGGRARWLVILWNGAFLLVSVLVLVLSRGVT